jgi:hypothetical protein
MNRRRFLRTALLLGTSLAGAQAALALTRESCVKYPATPACRELLRHRTLLADLKASLLKRGLTAAQAQSILATAVCPYCGALLIG